MAALPRFFKIFLSHFSSESMAIPASYYDELPLVLPKTALLQGSGGRFWKVAMMKKRDEVYFGQGWAEFVQDTRLRDGDVLTFVYDGCRKFKVSIYGSGGCKEARTVAQVIAIDDEEDTSVCHLSSEDTNTPAEPEMAQTVPRTMDKGPKANWKKKAVEDPDESFTSEESKSRDTSSEPENATRVPITRNKGKRKAAVEDSEDSFISEDSNNNDSSYSLPDEDYVTPRVADSRKKGNSKSVKSVVGSTSYSCHSATRTRTKPTIENPEDYLDDPKNLYFETSIKNRIFELLFPQQLIRDYCLKFEDYLYYIDNHKDGKLEGRIAIWSRDQRVCIKSWNHICKRNGFRRGDRLLCELLRNGDVVYAIKVHPVTTPRHKSFF